MKRINDLLPKYINALRKCAKEHENDFVPTFNIRITDLCNDTAKLLEELEQESYIPISVLEDIKAEIEELDYVTFDNITKKECIRIIDKHISKEKQTREVKVW